MLGSVRNLQATVEVTIRIPGQSSINLECVVETGFAGALTLPPAAVEALGLPHLTELDANLADDSTVTADVHVATVLWHGVEREVAVLALGRRPLLGTVLLEGCHLEIDFADAGAVSIDPL